MSTAKQKSTEAPAALATASFDAALAASQQVAATIKDLSRKRDTVMAEIKCREQELERHNEAPVPESDLIDFFSEYVDVAIERGRKALTGHLESILYPARYSTPKYPGAISPLSFEEITAILKGTSDGMHAWMVDKLPQPLPDHTATGAINTGVILTFLLKDQIKAGIRQLLEETPIHYRTPNTGGMTSKERAEFAAVSIGLPLKERRERVEVLKAEVSELWEEKSNIESQIAKLKGGAAC